MPGSAGLVWGQQDVMMDAFNAAGYRIEASADGTNWGNPEAVITAVRSRLQDGSLAQVTSDDNREAPVKLRVRGETYDGLVAGEEALVAEKRRQGYNTLTYLPPVEDAVASVFDVVYAVLTFDLDDLTEARLERHYTATLTCLPFPRAAEETVAEAVGPPPVTPTNVTVDNGSSTSNWSASYRASSVSAPVTLTPATSSGSVVSAAGVGQNGGYINMTRTGSVSLSSTKYVMVDWYSDQAFIAPTANGGALVQVSMGSASTAGYTRTIYEPSPLVSSVSSLDFVFDGVGAPMPLSVRVDQIIRTDTLPALASRYQLLRSLPVAGSERTQGRLAIEHATAGLGDVIAYTFMGNTLGYSPPMRQYRTSGALTPEADSTTVSGYLEALGEGPVVYEVPTQFVPAGNYRAMARLRPSPASAGVSQISGVATTLVAGAEVGPAATALATIDMVTGWAIYDLFGLTLPTNRLANVTGGKVRLTLESVGISGPTPVIDEVWLFNVDIGTLTVVSCGTGTGAAGGPSNRLWLDPATVTNDGQPAVYVGHAADRSDAFNPGTNIKAWTPPIFEPPAMNVFTVTTGTENALVSLQHFRRSLHHIRAVA